MDILFRVTLEAGLVEEDSCLGSPGADAKAVINQVEFEPQISRAKIFNVSHCPSISCLG